MHQMPIADRTIHGGILAHRGNDDAVFKSEVAEFDRRKEGTHFLDPRQKRKTNGYVKRNSRPRQRYPELKIISSHYAERSMKLQAAAFFVVGIPPKLICAEQ
jgi:hypothetical protein